jgi:transcriptional regulator with XRE-family HTH domain
MAKYTIEHARVKCRAAAYRGWTLAQLATATGVTRQAVELTLKGGRLSLAVQERMAGVIGIPREQLLAPLLPREILAAARWYLGIGERER